MAKLKTLTTAFGVSIGVGDAMSATQHLTRDLADHRGLLEMPAYTMMAESVTGGTFWHSFDEAVATVQSWLSLTAAAPLTGPDGRLYATSELLHKDDEQGAVTLHIADAQGHAVCAGLARCVLVGRPGDGLAAIKRTMTTEPPLDVQPTAVLPAPIDAGLDGRQILAAIDSGTIAPGPLCDLLAATVTTTKEQVRLAVSPQDWMANPLGAIQGGVIATMLAQACSLAGQLPTGPGQRYSMVDLSVYFFRSPPFDEAVTVVAAPDRVGRRLATVSATMIKADGGVFARATANIRYQNRGQ